MGCFGWDRGSERRSISGCFERSSPALQQILVQLCRAQNQTEIDHHLYEFGSVEYHLKSSASDPYTIYLSISTPTLCHRDLTSNGLCPCTIQKVKEICPSAIDILEEAREGYQLTLQLKIADIPQGKDEAKVIKEIAAIESVILISQLKEMLHNYTLEETTEGTFKPIRLMYRPREPFFVIRQPHKITVIFPMNFKETSDVIIGTSFFQELMDIGSSDQWTKAPPCTWSPIPPSELRGELIQDLSTNAGFVSFDIFARHINSKRLGKTVWNLLNFYTYVKSHIKSTKGFIQRKLRRRLEDLVKVLHQPDLDEDEHHHNLQGCGWKMKPVKFPRFKKFRKRYGDFNNKIKRIRYRIKTRGFSELNKKIKRIRHGIKTRGLGRIHLQWFSIPKFHPTKGYTKLN